MRSLISINAEKSHLWRAVDQDRYVLGEVLQIREGAKASRCLLTRLLRKQGYRPPRSVTERPGSYGAAMPMITSKIEHRGHKGLDNHAENSDAPVRNRERRMRGFWSRPSRQQFVSTFSSIRIHFASQLSRRTARSVYLHCLNAIVEEKSIAPPLDFDAIRHRAAPEN